MDLLSSTAATSLSGRSTSRTFCLFSPKRRVSPGNHLVEVENEVEHGVENEVEAEHGVEQEHLLSGEVHHLGHLGVKRADDKGTV